MEYLTVKVTNILKEFNKVTLFVTYFYIRTKLAIVVVVVSSSPKSNDF